MRDATTYMVPPWRRYRMQWNSALTMPALWLATAGALLFVLYSLTVLTIRWTERRLDDLRYGYPRTFQTDGTLTARPAAARPVHVVVQNLKGQVWIMVLPEAPAEHTMLIKGPQLAGSSRALVPATVALRDVSGDGRTDLVLNAGGRTFVYLQDARRRTFVLSRPSAGAAGRRSGAVAAVTSPSTRLVPASAHVLPSGAEYHPASAAIAGYGVRGKPTISPALINQVLSAYDSPLAGQGQAVYDLGVKYGIDPAFCLAFFVQESAAGTRGEAVLTHSVGNLRPEAGMPSMDGYRYYNTWLEGAEDWYRLISDVYVGQWGLTTVDTIIPVYAPSGDNNDVAAYIQNVEQLVASWRAQGPASS